jgi:hypothetical protein
VIPRHGFAGRVVIQQRRLMRRPGVLRTVGPIAEAAYGLRIKRATYLRSVETIWREGVAELTASRDFRAIVNADLFTPIGDTMGRYYVATESLKAEWARIRGKWPKRPESDHPFKLIEMRDQLTLDVA